MATILRLFLLLAAVFFAAVAADDDFHAGEDAHAPSADLGIIKQTCANTEHPDICVEALMHFPEARTADPHNLAELAIRAAAIVGTKYANYVYTLRNTGEDCVDYCGEEYEDAISQLDDSTNLMDNKQYEDVKKRLGAAIAGIDTCEAECQAATLPDKVNFSEKNLEFRHLCGVVLSMVNLLK